MLKHVVIIGGGFAGLNAAKVLEEDRDVRVTIVDQRNHHLFQPLLYQVATAGLSPADIAMPIRSIFRGQKNVAVHLGRVTSINTRDNTVTLMEGQLKFDYLVLACGAWHSYFGHPEWEEYAPGLKTLEQAIEMRRRLLHAFEAAENETDPVKLKSLLTFVVVGGGPTGVELAGAIADISRTVLLKDFRRIDPKSAQIILLEAGPRILPAFKEILSAHATQDLKDLGVDVRVSAAVTGIDPEGVYVNRGNRIDAKTVFWAAGVQGAPIARTLGVPLDRTGRIPVQPDLSIPGVPHVFAAGDIINLQMPDKTFVPGLAPAAIQAGRAAARNILALIHGKPTTPFQFYGKGLMATIGTRKAIAQAGNLNFSGFIAWLAWLFVHLLFLIGFRNRVSVLLEWVWSYLFARRGARLITEREWRNGA
jgi:NADH:ubiquinone reductase (H+-translocating)